MSYIVGHPIKRPEDFYGRHEQLLRFFEIIGGTQAQSLSVLGVRRAGKTSFLQYVAHEAVMARFLPDPDNYVMVYMDMTSCKSPGEFYYRLQMRLKSLLGKGQQVTLWKESPPEQTKMYDVEAILCQHPERRVVLLLDEFDHLRVGEFGQDFLTELRAMTGVLDYELACVTASYWDLYQLGSHIGLPPTSPFYNIFYPTPIYLNGLDPAAVVSLIKEPASKMGVALGEREIQGIRQLAGSLPFFVQATAAKWTNEMKLGHRPAFSKIGSHMVSVLSPYFAQWWRHLKPVERDFLSALARHERTSKLPYSDLEITEATRRLRHYGLIERDGDGFQVNGAIATIWIQSHAGKIVLDGRSPGNGTAVETLDPASIRHSLVAHFSLEELRTLCFDLGVDFDVLGGTGKGAKARELVTYWQNRGDLNRLVAAIRVERGAVV